MRLKEGNEQAFGKIYDRYFAPLYLHAYNRLRDREEAKDMVHDLFAHLWAKRESLHIESGLSSYLYTAVRNRVIDFVSHQKVSSAYIQSFAGYLGTENNQTDHAVREKELLSLIEREIAKLPPRVQMVFELSRKENLSYKEIAERLDISEQTVRGYVKHALKALRLRFGSLFVLALCAYFKLF